MNHLATLLLPKINKKKNRNTQDEITNHCLVNCLNLYLAIRLKMSFRTKKRLKVLFSQIVLNETLRIFVDFGDFTDTK